MFPTFCCCFNQNLKFNYIEQIEAFPVIQEHQYLHAEDKIYFVHLQLFPNVKYEMTVEIVDLADKGKFASLVTRLCGYVAKDGKRDLAFYIDRNTFIRDMGGFGFKGKDQSKIVGVPNSKPDFIIKDKSFPSQPFLYRLSGDYNPLHINPKVSRMAGFERPILHGISHVI